jgi:hypothetical protein
MYVCLSLCAIVLFSGADMHPDEKTLATYNNQPNIICQAHKKYTSHMNNKYDKLFSFVCLREARVFECLPYVL